jgi:hypothetical protein
VNRIRSITCALALILLGAGPASADVRLRLGVQPDTLVHCGSGHVTFALWNDGVDTLQVRVFVSLDVDSTRTVGPRPFRLRLAPRELVKRDFEFAVPPSLPVGDYTLGMLVMGSDSTRAGVRAKFTVALSRCTIGDAPAAAPELLLDSIAAGIDLDVPTPTLRSTWGEVKRRYDSTSR